MILDHTWVGDHDRDLDHFFRDLPMHWQVVSRALYSAKLLSLELESTPKARLFRNRFNFGEYSYEGTVYLVMAETSILRTLWVRFFIGEIMMKPMRFDNGI